MKMLLPVNMHQWDFHNKWIVRFIDYNVFVADKLISFDNIFKTNRGGSLLRGFELQVIFDYQVSAVFGKYVDDQRFYRIFNQELQACGRNIKVVCISRQVIFYEEIFFEPDAQQVNVGFEKFQLIFDPDYFLFFVL